VTRIRTWVTTATT